MRDALRRRRRVARSGRRLPASLRPRRRRAGAAGWLRRLAHATSAASDPQATLASALRSILQVN